MYLSTLANFLCSFFCLPVNDTTKVLYEPKANYEIDRIEAMIDQNNRFISKVQMNYLIRDFHHWQNFLHDQQN
jgi:hypothetical protein